jgi:hypothetical protein
MSSNQEAKFNNPCKSPYINKSYCKHATNNKRSKKPLTTSIVQPMLHGMIEYLAPNVLVTTTRWFQSYSITSPSIHEVLHKLNIQS